MANFIHANFSENREYKRLLGKEKKKCLLSEGQKLPASQRCYYSEMYRNRHLGNIQSIADLLFYLFVSVQRSQNQNI